MAYGIFARGRFGTLFAMAMVIAACGASKKRPAPPVSDAKVVEPCPDLTKADELAAFDFAGRYNLSSADAEKLKAATLAAMEIGVLSEKLDADFGIACAQIAHDLGDKGDWRSGNEACEAASVAVKEARAKLGPKAKARLVVRQPVCLTDASLVTKCASLCDSSVPAEKVRAECKQKAGRCDGDCDGSCEPKGAAKCAGVCSGTCDGPVKGACGGRCIGMCDGKRTNGPCLGVCVGTCDRGAILGECKGNCTGACELAKPAVCDGVCSGTCSVELASAKCVGEIESPDVSPDCRARCGLAIIRHTECSAPQVGFVVTGVKDRETSEAMKSAVDKSFPALLKILHEVGESGAARVLAAQAILESVRDSTKEVARAEGSASADETEALLVKCFDEPFKKAVASAASMKTGIDRALSVRDEVSK